MPNIVAGGMVMVEAAQPAVPIAAAAAPASPQTRPRTMRKNLPVSASKIAESPLTESDFRWLRKSL
jgi:hypothetical protein